MKIDYKKISGIIKIILAGSRKILWGAGKHAFLSVLILILLDVILGVGLFYKYVYLAENKVEQIDKGSFQFRDEVYQKALNQWQARDEKLKNYLQINYPSPF
jgi:hypothetical protein